MIVVCNPEEAPMWYDKPWQNTVDLFRSMDIPVRTLECCSGDLADLKVKSVDVEAWSPQTEKNTLKSAAAPIWAMHRQEDWVSAYRMQKARNTSLTH